MCYYKLDDAKTLQENRFFLKKYFSSFFPIFGSRFDQIEQIYSTTW
jgi:hypothetical protein